MLRLQWDDVQPLRTLIKKMAEKYGKSMAQVSLNWCIQHGVIPLVGCRSPSQARDTVGCLGWNLSPEDVQQLDRVALAKSTLESKFVDVWLCDVSTDEWFSVAVSFLCARSVV